MTKHRDLFAALAAPFQPEEVKVRTTAGRQLHYITARTAMNRLDNVLGPENWWDDYTPHENSVLCRLTIRLPDGSTLTKADAGGYAGMADSGDDDKSGYSDAFKRACVKVGVGRYLYRDGVPTFVQEWTPPAEQPPQRPEPPTSPAPVPQPPPRPSNPTHVNGHGPSSPPGPAPRTGKQMFAWVKEQEQRYEVGLLRYMNQWAKLNDLPGRMIDWDADQVGRGHAEARRKLAAVAHDSDAHAEAVSN